MPKGLSRRAVFNGLLVTAVLLSAGCKDGCKGGGSTSGGGGEAIKVGVLMTLSGPQGGIGKELEQGIKLAFEQAGMKIGNKRIDIVEKDDKNDPQTAVALLKELTEKD